MAANYLSQPEKRVVSIKEEQFIQKPPGLTIEVGAILTENTQLEGRHANPVDQIGSTNPRGFP